MQIFDIFGKLQIPADSCKFVDLELDWKICEQYLQN